MKLQNLWFIIPLFLLFTINNLYAKVSANPSNNNCYICPADITPYVAPSSADFLAATEPRVELSYETASGPYFYVFAYVKDIKNITEIVWAYEKGGKWEVIRQPVMGGYNYYIMLPTLPYYRVNVSLYPQPADAPPYYTIEINQSN